MYEEKKETPSHAVALSRIPARYSRFCQTGHVRLTAFHKMNWQAEQLIVFQKMISFQCVAGNLEKEFVDVDKMQICQKTNDGHEVDIDTKKEESNYPENILKILDVHTKAGTRIDYKNLSEDQKVGLAFAISQLKENEQEVIRLRYREGLTFQNIGERIRRCRDRACRIHAGAMRKLGHPSLRDWYVYGYESCKEKREEQARKKVEMDKLRMPKESCTALGMTYGIISRLRDAGIETIGMLQEVMKQADWQESVKGIGYRSANKIVHRMLELGLADDSFEAVKEYRQRQVQ